MRRFWPAFLAVTVSAWGTSAFAQSVYDGDSGPYDDGPPGFRETIPEPPPPPDSPYELLPDEVRPTPFPPEVGGPAEEAAGPGEAEQEWQYNGPHPINEDYGSGWCNVQGRHYHPYPPFDDHLFQEDDDGGYYFLGDPADFGYGGELSWYYGPHPIATGWGIGWCFIPWAHRHIYAPFGAYFGACGGYYCYNGPFDAWYWYYRPFWFPYWNYWYPHYYRGGRYHHTGQSASPGRWGHVGGIRGGRHGQGAPVGRPGGYARPAPSRPVPLVRRAAPSAPLHRIERPRTLENRLMTPSWVAPRPRTYTVGRRQYGVPSRPRSAPRTYVVPRPAGPRAFGPRLGGGAPRFSRPGGSRPQFSPPRGGSRPQFSPPRGGGRAAPRSFGSGPSSSGARGGSRSSGRRR